MRKISSPAPQRGAKRARETSGNAVALDGDVRLGEEAREPEGRGASGGTIGTERAM